MQEVHTNGGVRSASGTYRARPEVSHTLATKIGAKRHTRSTTAEMGEPAVGWANQQSDGSNSATIQVGTMHTGDWRGVGTCGVLSGEGVRAMPRRVTRAGDLTEHC